MLRSTYAGKRSIDGILLNKLFTHSPCVNNMFAVEGRLPVRDQGHDQPDQGASDERVEPLNDQLRRLLIVLYTPE